MPRNTKEQTKLEEEKKKTTAKKAATKKVATTKKATTKKTTAKKTATKKTTTKKTATKKVATKETPTKKTATKKTPAKKATTEKVSETKKATTAKVSTTKKATAKKATTKATTAKKAASTTKKTATKKTAATKKSTTNKTTAKKATTKKATTKKTTSKKVAKKTTTKRTTAKKAETKKGEILEYYDLPYRYNQTVVKVLAQTPTTLFIYWDISDGDRKNFENKFGENFFEQTKPILIVTNNTMGYSFEVEINDFANSWYLHVNDSNCEYKIELGRRPVIKTEKLNVDYIYITSSNEIEAPNDRILFDKNQKMIYFRDVKTGIETKQMINNLSFIRSLGKYYDISENISINKMNILTNPSSGSVYKY